MYKYIKISHFTKSRSNSRSKAEKQMFEDKTIHKKNYSSLETGWDLSLGD